MRALVLAAVLLPGCSHLVERSNCGIVSLESDPAVGGVARGAKYAGWALGAPVTVALAPVAALAWATPWVDLPQAVDFASAPAAALGYAVEGVIGYPARGIARLLPQRVAAEKVEPSWVPWGFVAEHHEATLPFREPEPLPRDIAERYRLDPRRVDALRAELDRQLKSMAVLPRQLTVPLESRFPTSLELYFSDATSAKPFVLITPPLKAVLAARYLARRLARDGVHAGMIVPGKKYLDIATPPDALEEQFRELVVVARTALHAVRPLPCVDPTQLHYFGISAGGIFGAALLAVEPAISRAALVLPGGGFPRILCESTESEVRAWREAWIERGAGVAKLEARLAASIRTDPLLLARYVDPRRVLLILGSSDTKVPVALGFALREAMGGPECYVMAGNHATACICFGFLLRRTKEFLLAEAADLNRRTALCQFAGFWNDRVHRVHQRSRTLFIARPGPIPTRWRVALCRDQGLPASTHGGQSASTHGGHDSVALR